MQLIFLRKDDEARRNITPPLRSFALTLRRMYFFAEYHNGFELGVVYVWKNISDLEFERS